MESITGKIQIGLLEGKSNWDTWKYKVTCLLRMVPKAIEVVDGSFQRPTAPTVGAGDADLSAFNVSLEQFIKADANALLLLTTNMKEETLRKVMRFTNARDVWLELHRLYDGTDEDKAYNLCMSFFGYKKDASDDIATHMSKLKNIWTQLNQELKKSNERELPELLLICKILDTLDETFFAFRSSWLLLPKTDRTVESLTSHLCSYEQALKNNLDQEALVTNMNRTPSVNVKKDKKLKCNYCQEIGHRVKHCKKWIKDGKPPKSSNDNPSTSKFANMILSIQNTEVSSVEKDNENWYVDNGATSHVSNRAELFHTFEHFEDNRTVTTANGDAICAKGKGSVIVEANVRGKVYRITLQDVWYVPAINKNLFSVLATHDRISKSVFSSNTKECSVFVNGEECLIGRRQRQGGLYRLDVKNVPPVIPPEVCVTSATMQLYHERLAHQNKRHVKATVKRELGLDLPLDKETCEGCIYGKAHRLKFGTRTRATAPGELIHTDVCGPFQESVSKLRYYVLFKDDFTGYRMVYFLKQKSEVKLKLALMIAQTKAQGHTIKCLLSDNGGEFDNESIRKILDAQGIKQRLITPYTPEQNGSSERENRTLVETARSMMYAHEPLPQELWAELINTAAYILNRTGPTHSGKSPYELWCGNKPIIKHLRIIGSTAYVHIPKQKRKKMDKKAVKGRLIGYDDDGYRIWLPDGSLVRSRDVIFDEKPIESQSESVEPHCVEYDLQLPTPANKNPDTQSCNHPLNREPEGDISNRNESNLEGESDVTDYIHEEFVDRNHFEDDVRNRVLDADHNNDDQFVDAQDTEIQEPRYNLRDRGSLRAPHRYNDFVCLSETDSLPETFQEAMKMADKNEWLKAMQSEMKSLNENNVWSLCDLPQNKKALPCKWVFRIKRNPDCSIDKYKARLVIKGYKQRKGVDYDQTFSPVARLATIRSILAVSAQETLHIMQFDVSTAFLHGKLSEEIYMKQPDGFNDDTSRVCRLNRSLYGLKQAPRCWNTCFEEILLDMGFKQSDADCCLFSKKVGEKKILITLYVDDGLIAATDADLANEFLDDLKKILKITSKPASYYLGLEIEKTEDGSIKITQESYAKRILERFGMDKCNPVSTPIEKEGIQTGKVSPTNEKSFPYREAVGALAYLMVGSRPDIAYAVGVVSRKLESPTSEDWNKVKRIFRYLKGTTALGIRYSKGPIQVLGYSDADHAGDNSTGRSTTGVVCLYAGAAVSWLSQRQATVAISTTEAEIVAASEAAKELVWLQRIFESITDIKEMPSLRVDNEAAIRLAHNPEFHKRTKHIRVRHFFVREMVQGGILTVDKSTSADQLADVLTKAVPKPRLLDLRCRIGMV